MYRRILSLILCMCILITSCSNHKVSSDDLNVGKVYDGKYELSALKSNKQGIDKSTSFQLTSKEKINKKYIKDNLQIIPEQEYKIEEVTSTVYNIIPTSNLENDKVYQVKLNEESYVYSWAFQTKKKFEVESTLPSNDSTYVPDNSGIEIYFTLGNLDKIDEFFNISPHVDGKFIQNDKSVIFVPEKLESKARYTVTIKKGFGMKDVEQKLEEDYIFSFSTYRQNSSHIYFYSPLSSIYEKNAKIIEGYVNMPNENAEYSINIYEYNNADDFAKNITNYASTGKVTNNDDAILDAAKINTLKQKPFIKDKTYNNKALFQLPEELTKGYYLLEFYIDGYKEKYYQFMQINDMMMYNAFFENEIFVFSADCKTSKGINNAEVFLNDQKLGSTDKDGVLSCKKDTSIYKNKTMCIKIKAKGYNDFIYADNFYFYNYYENIRDVNKYLMYIDTDRPVYLPTDKVNVWGFARYRDDKSINKLRLELVETNTNLLLESQLVDLTNIGTYQTEFVLNNIISENCVINVYDNDIKISEKYIQISEYTKPLFIMKGEFDKEYVYSGENINYKIKGNFFDGYPVQNIDIKFYTHSYSYSGDIQYGFIESNTKLDVNGEALISVNTNLTSNSWRPVAINMNSWNGTAEDKTVNAQDSFIIFPKHNMLEIEQNNINEPQSVDILFHELDNSKYEKLHYDDYKYLRGKPLDGSTGIEIVESYYEKVKVREHYDFINKINVIDYKYNLVENKVYHKAVNITGGIANIKIPEYKEDRNYKIIAYYEDGKGGIREELHVGGRYYNHNERAYYSLERSDNKENYRLNENANLQLKYDNKNVENIDHDKLIVLLMRDGLVDYKVVDNTKAQLSFDEAYLPNVMLNCLYIKNGYTYAVDYTDELYYDRTEKQIYFDVITDKENYSPGEEVVLNIKAKDENNKPCVADVNISVVDEAYFAVFEKRINTLENLYSYSWDSGLRKTYLSNIDFSLDERGMAEMGGGGGEYVSFRDEFKDTNIFKSVKTDKNGKVSMKFKLADNLTSWRITYQGISDKQFAGSGTKNIKVSLPFYVDLIMGKEYLKEDKISATLRVFGTEAKESEIVNYNLKIKDKETGEEKEYNQTGVAGKYTNVFLDKLNEGNYEIYVYADCKGHKDGIKEEFKIVDSTMYFNNTEYYKLSEKTILNNVYSNPLITLFNESNSDFYNSLNNIASGNGRRIDQTVCVVAASKFINDNFQSDFYYNEEEMLKELDNYESRDGGYKLLPYSEADAQLTAKLIYTAKNDYLDAKTKLYFKNILDNTKEYNTNIAASLWGLSKNKEPVLLTIYDLLEKNTNLEARDIIYLSLALTELGDDNTAKKYYRQLVEQSIKSGDYLYFDNKTNETDQYEITALLSLLGVKLKDYENSDKLFKYVYRNPSKYTLTNFEQLIYIMNRDIMNLKEIKDLFGEVTVTSDGSKKTYKLKLFDREVFAVTKEKIKDIKFSNIKGSIACKVEALGNEDDLDKNKTTDISLNISYMLKGSTKEQIEYNHADVVKVTLTPSFNNAKADSNFYEITYVIPSGFRYIEADAGNKSWAQVNGQKLKFDFFYNKEYPDVKPIVFYIQASQAGEYTVDYVVIKECLENKLNYLNKSALKVK